MKPTPQKDTVLATITEFPKAGSRTIADVLVQRHPRLFKDIETARSQVRYYRGNSGIRQRKALTTKTHLRANGAAGRSFPELPEGKTSFEDWGALEIDGPCRVLALGDIHVPYQDKRALEAAVERGKNADVVILNGDVMDCYELSSFEKDPRKCNFGEAVRVTRELLVWVRNKFPKARIIFKGANHEYRLERYFYTRAPAVIGVPEFELKNLLDLASLGIEWLAEKRPIRAGKIHTLHGDELGRGGGVNPARALFLKAKVHAIENHFHRSSQHQERDLKGEIISTWSLPCLCDLRPAYAPFNDWSHGAGEIEIAKDGSFRVDAFTIIDGRVF